MTFQAIQGTIPGMDETFSQRLERLVAASGMSARKVSIKAGLNPTLVRDILSGPINSPRTETVRALALALDIPISELMPDAAGSSVTAAPPPQDGLEFHGATYMALPVYDVDVSAGPGAINVDRPEPEAWHLFAMEALRTVTRAPARDLAMVRVSGDSMAPTLCNEDLILVDRSIRKMGRDGMYILAWGDDIMVKRISVDFATRTLTIASDNPIYKTSTGVQPDDIGILGRVVWISRNVGG